MKLKNKIINICIEVSIIETLSRVLYECITQGDNLKPWDSANVSSLLNMRISNLKDRLKTVSKILKI